MAKSLRSKRRRKARAEKRIVNAKKELVKLREIAAKLRAGTDKGDTNESIPDVQIVDAPMIVDKEDTKVSKKDTLKINNQWMNQRKIKSIKRKLKRQNKNKARKGRMTSKRARK